MRFNAALASALFSSATLMGYVQAEETEAAPDATSTAIERPTFTVCSQPALVFR
jgi:calnexin